MGPDWFDRATAADLESLADALESGRLACACGDASASAAGLEGADAALASLGATPTEVAARLLRRLADERAMRMERFARMVQLVWTGPAPDREGLRDTRSVLLELMRRAERSVVLTTYVLSGGEDVLAGLADRVRERPSLDVEIYADVSTDEGGPPQARDERFRERFRTQYWPNDLRLPALFHVRPPARGEPGVVLHAKLAVVDERYALVTSANLTGAAQERNVEAGVLLDHPVLARALVARLHRLRAAGIVVAPEP